MFTTGQIKINSTRVLEEMKTYVADEKGSMNATSGNHDDCVMATALALQGLKQGMYYRF